MEKLESLDIIVVMVSYPTRSGGWGGAYLIWAMPHGRDQRLKKDREEVKMSLQIERLAGHWTGNQGVSKILSVMSSVPSKFSLPAKMPEMVRMY